MLDTIKTIAETFQYFALGLAVLVGGGWTVFHFFIQRESATSLQMKASIDSSVGKNGNSIVFIDVILKNTGRTKMNARPKKSSEGKPKPLSQDDFETLYHSCGLQIRQLDAQIDGNALYDWYGSSNVTKVKNIPAEINLLDDYEIDKNGEIAFWLEPGDTVHLGTAMALHPGHYFAKVTFLGTSKKQDYWERYFHFQVPAQHDQKSSSEGLFKSTET